MIENHPAKAPDFDLIEKLNEDLLATSPSWLWKAQTRILEMGGFVKEMLHATKNYFNDENENHYQECLDNEEKVDYYNHVIHDYLLKIRTESLNGKVVISQAGWMRSRIWRESPTIA